MQFLLSGESIHPEGQAQEKKSGPDEESKQRWLQGDDAQELIPEKKKRRRKKKVLVTYKI